MNRIAEAELSRLVSAAFRATSMRADMAGDAARVLVTAEMMGIGTHGLAKVPSYVDRLRDGGVNPKAVPVITSPAPALRHVDGQNGLGSAVAMRAMHAALDAAENAGIGAAFCRASSHLGALAPQLLLAADAGYAAIATSNSAPMIAAPGGRKAVIGNQPIGIALPDPAGCHVILDIALSLAARSKVRRAAEVGEPIPDSWATDAEGQPTTDAAAALKGHMQAIGGTKGANLALALDLLTGVLAGSSILSEIPNANLDTTARANLGHVFLVIDTAKLVPPRAVSTRLADARAILKSSAAPDGATPPRFPGDRALANLAEARSKGIAVAPEILARLEEMAAS